jgi:carboxypeptidase Q
MRPFRTALLAAAATFALPAAAQTGTPAASTQTDRIVAEGTTNSEVMRIAQYLTDVIGARLTNSPGMRRAEDWTQAKFREWGLTNVHKEGFEFGRGWSSQGATMRMVAPRPLMLTAAPLAWTPGTTAPVSAPVVLAPLTDDASFAQYRGKLKGALVLVTEPTDPTDATDPAFKRWTEEEIAKRDTYELPNGQPSAARRGGGAGAARFQFAARRDAFLREEGAVGFATMSSRPNKLVHGQNSQFQVGATPTLPAFEIAAEDYRRLARLVRMGAAPTVEFSASNSFDDSDTKGYNIIADIAGSDPRAGYVMAGAHMDSWAMGDGAADNAAGVSMVMEAARIIRASGIRTRRTIRFALWSGEEQGLLGSMNYVEMHVATRPVEAGLSGVARYMGWSRGFPIAPGPDHGKLSAYFNIDNGSGRLRGINTQGNLAVVPIFKEWLAPFHALDADHVVTARTGSTDHVFFDAVGIPAFQFIQDPLDYGSTVHHTNVDTFDHLRADDMREGAIILAAMLIQAANAPQMLPRVPLATEPKPADGFYAWPNGEGAH